MKPSDSMTPTAKHTPGPWQALGVKDNRGRVCAYSVWPDLDRPFADSPRGNQICRLPDGTGPERHANARLIAASPALLAAAEAAYEELHGYADAGSSNKAGHICDQLRSAIAMAKGEK